LRRRLPIPSIHRALSPPVESADRLPACAELQIRCSHRRSTLSSPPTYLPSSPGFYIPSACANGPHLPVIPVCLTSDLRLQSVPPARLFMKPPACAVCTIVSLLGGHSSLLLRFLVHAACAAWSIAALARILVLSAKFAANFRLSPLISPSTQLLIRYRFPTR